MLDEAGFNDCKIVASNALDETIIRDLLIEGAKVDLFGVGERLITSRSEPVFGGVYKLVAVKRTAKLSLKIKLSDHAGRLPIRDINKYGDSLTIGAEKQLRI